LETNLGFSEGILTVCAGKVSLKFFQTPGARREFLGPGARGGANPYGALKRGKPKSGCARGERAKPISAWGPGLQQGKRRLGKSLAAVPAGEEGRGARAAASGRRRPADRFVRSPGKGAGMLDDLIERFGSGADCIAVGKGRQ
jgi:hypothetical protein